MVAEKKLKVLSLAHTNTPINIRELLHLSQVETEIILNRLQSTLSTQECLVLSTCNRTEVYYISDQDLSIAIADLLCRSKGIQHPENYYDYFDIALEEELAIQYLFEVAMGLHAHLLGDLQIAGQVKQAYSLSHAHDMAGAFLHRLMHTVFHTHKRVQQETGFRDGAASSSYAAKALAEQSALPSARSSILVLGLGAMGSDVARNLNPQVFSQVHLMNPSYSKADTLAAELGMKAIPYELLDQVVADYDIIVSALAADQSVLRPFHFLPKSRPSTTLIDLSVPRSIDPTVDLLSHIYLYNIDDIQSLTQHTLRQRQAAIPTVQAIIQEEMATFLLWRRQLQLSPIIHQLKAALEQIRQEELHRLNGTATDKENQLMETVTKRMVHKIMKMPVLQLKEACRRGEAEGLSAVLRELFDLEPAKARKRAV